MITRSHIESAVISVNKHLKDAVKDMDLVTLLRNCHPLYRIDFAKELHRDKQLSDFEAAEFTNLGRHIR